MYEFSRSVGQYSHSRGVYARFPQGLTEGSRSTGRGNYSMGVKEQIVFPEIDYDKIDALRGMDITITTTAKTDEEGGRCWRRSLPIQELR